MAAVRAEPRPRRWTVWGFAFERKLTLSPAAGALLAAGLVGIGVFADKFVNRDDRLAIEQPTAVASRLPVSDTVFVFVAPSAAQVSLVGDFNDWDESKFTSGPPSQ